MKNLVKISLIASLLTSVANSEQFNRMFVAYGNATGEPYLITNHYTLQPIMSANMMGPDQYVTNYNERADLVVMEDFNMMKRTWIAVGGHKQFQDTPQEIAYREKAWALEIKAQKMVFFSDPLNVQKLNLVTVLYTHLTWYLVAGCFVFAFLFKKPSSQFEDALGQGLFMSLLSVGAMVLQRNQAGSVILVVIALALGTIVFSSIKNRLQGEDAK